MATLIVILLAINIFVLLIGIGRIIRTIQSSVGVPLAETLNARSNPLMSENSPLYSIEFQIREQFERVRRNQEIIVDRLEDIKENQKDTHKMTEQQLSDISGYCYATTEAVNDLVRNIDN